MEVAERRFAMGLLRHIQSQQRLDQRKAEQHQQNDGHGTTHRNRLTRVKRPLETGVERIQMARWMIGAALRQRYSLSDEILLSLKCVSFESCRILKGMSNPNDFNEMKAF